MDCDLYADLELSNSEAEDDKDGISRPDENQAEMDLMDQGLTNKFKSASTSRSAPLPRVDIEVEKLKHEVASLKEQNKILERNLVLLYKTAHHVLNLKDKELSNLKTKYDAMCFRRRDQTNPSALPSIAPVADRTQRTSARAPDRQAPGPSTSRRMMDQPKRPVMSKEFSMLRNYAQGCRRPESDSPVTGVLTAEKSLEAGSNQSDRDPIDPSARGRELKQLRADRSTAVRRSNSPNERSRDSLRRQNHSERVEGRSGGSRTACRSSRNRSPVRTREEHQNDRKRPRGSSHDGRGAKRVRSGRVDGDKSSGTEQENFGLTERDRSQRSRRNKEENPKGDCQPRRIGGVRDHSSGDERKRKLTRSPSDGGSDALRKDRRSSAERRGSDASTRGRSDHERKRNERSPGGHRREERPRTSGSTRRGNTPREDTHKQREGTSRGKKSTETKRRVNSNHSNECSVRESGRSADTTSSRSAVAERKEKIHTELGGDDGAMKASRRRRIDSGERVLEKESTDPSEGSSRDRKYSGRRMDVVNHVETENATRRRVPNDQRLDGIDSENGDDIVGANHRSKSHKGQGDSEMKDCVVVARGMAVGRTPSSRDKTGGPPGIRAEEIVREDRKLNEDAPVSQRSQPGNSSKPTFGSEKEVTELRSESPAGVEVNHCDTSRASGEGSVVEDENLLLTSTPLLPLRRSPRKGMKTELDAKARESSGHHIQRVFAEDVPPELEEGEIEQSSMESREEARTRQFRAKEVVELRRSPRKSVRDRQLLGPPVNPQFHGVIESPHMIRPSPTKLQRRSPREIPSETVSVGKDPRVDREIPRPQLFKTICWRSSPSKIDSHRPPTFPLEFAMSSSPRRSPRKLQAKRLTEGDTTLLQSLLDHPQGENLGSAKDELVATPPKALGDSSISAHNNPLASLVSTSWMDDVVFDPSKPPETPGKDLNLSELSLPKS